MTIPNLSFIGERINPGFKSTRAMLDANDIPGIQALAVKQAEAGAAYLNVNVDLLRAKKDPQYLIGIIEAIQDVVDIPLSFDFPDLTAQQICLKTYDPAKAGGKKPIINSICETRWEIMEAARIQPVRLLVMSSEALVNGAGVQCKTADAMVATTKRMVEKMLGGDYGLVIDDLIVDVAVATLSSDTEGRTRAALETVKRIHADPELKGIHMSAGLSNLAIQLPSVEIDGKPFKLQLESAFLTLAVPHGFDMVLGTPGRAYEMLPEDNTVLAAFKEIIEMAGLQALRALRKLYTGARK